MHILHIDIVVSLAVYIYYIYTVRLPSVVSLTFVLRMVRYTQTDLNPSRRKTI